MTNNDNAPDETLISDIKKELASVVEDVRQKYADNPREYETALREKLDEWADYLGEPESPENSLP